jgi:hypothetical protein
MYESVGATDCAPADACDTGTANIATTMPTATSRRENHSLTRSC